MDLSELYQTNDKIDSADSDILAANWLADDGTYLYYYDCENRLTDVNDANDDSVASYAYDYLVRRVSKTVDSNTTKYCYDGDQIIAEYNGSTLVRKFIYSPRIDAPLCMIVVAGESGTVYYYHNDVLGSVTALSDEAGAIVEKYPCDIFSQPNRTSGVHNPYMFTGRRYDTELSRNERDCINNQTILSGHIDGDETFSFPVFFIKDEDGNWKIFKF